MKKIVICGGHLTPAQALISELQKKDNFEIYYFGRKYSLEGEKIPSVESQVIPSLGVTFVNITTGRLQRKFTRYTLLSLLKIPFGFFQSFYHLLRIKPDLIVSFGGYVSVPIVFSAWLLRIPILTHEQTIVFGLSSKINAFFSQKICVSFPESLKYFPEKKVVLTGNPLREEIFSVKKPSFFENLNQNLPIIYVTGGNQGSKIINQSILKILPELLEKYIIIHQSGELDYDYLKKQSANLKENLLKNYFLQSYFNSSEIGWVLNKADLIISRAGANSVCEIAALGKPALFIPIPWSSQDEQTKNAQMLVNIGIAEILSQKELSGEMLKEKILEMMKNLEKYKKNSSKAKSIMIPEATEKLSSEIEKLL